MLRRHPFPVVSRVQAALFGVVLGAVAALLVIPLVPSTQSVEPGEIASSTLTAERSVQYTSEVLTQEARDQAARQVEEVRLPPDPVIRDEKVGQLQRLLTDIASVRARPDLTAQQQLSELEKLSGINILTPAARQDILALDAATFDDFVQRAPRALGEILSTQVDETQVTAVVDSYLATQAPAWDAAGVPQAEREAIRKTFVGSQSAKPDERLIVRNYQVDQQGTANARQAAVANVAPVIVTYSKGQVIATQGEALSASAIEALRETGYLKEGFDYWKVAGGLVLAAAFGTVVAAYLYQLQPVSLAATRPLLLVGFSIVASLIAARIALPLVTPDHDGRYFAFGLPLATAAIVTASFAGLPFATIVAVAVGLFAAFIGAAAPNLAGSGFVTSVESLELGLVYTASGLAGALAVHRAERLSRYITVGVAVTVATGVVLGAFWLIGEPRANETLLWMALAASVNGIASALIAVGVFVMLSLLFGVTTRLQLMELVQSDHPLLRRLQDEAPGTYHHSMMVGALAERAADSIGADALVVRVGAYYHDIGKLAQPHYYIENLLDGASSPHAEMSPEQSAQVIREHVTKGLDIAARHHLPAVVRDFIPEHHGTRLVTFFYRQAAQSGQPVDPAAFRYVGPRPQTKETAIVMLADSCEAIVRAQQEGGRNIDELVDAIFAERLAEGQLDDCDLTMRELQEVANSFKSTLKAIYHPRIAYPNPTQEELEQVARAQDPATAP